MKKVKALLVMACALLLVAASVMGTMAYLTAETGEVKNTFTVGNVSFATSGLDEAKTNTLGQPIDSTGKVVAVASAPRVTGNAYKLVPGFTYTKDPTIHVGSDSEDCYLFVKVVNGISAIEATGNTTIAKQMEAKGWKAVTGAENVYVYYGVTGSTMNTTKTAVSAGADVVVFDNFTLSSDLGSDDLEDYEDATITITAYAVQTSGLESTTDAAIWTATFGAPAIPEQAE